MDPNFVLKFNGTNIYFSGHRAIVELLLKKGADINVRNMNGNTPLIEAAKWGNFQIEKSKTDHNLCIQINKTNNSFIQATNKWLSS